MSLADSAKLLASLDLKDNFTAPAAKVIKSIGGMESGFSKLKSAAGAGIGMAAGAGLSMTLTGANRLDAVMRQLQADTGMTDAAAKGAEHSIAGMYQNNLEGMDQIGASMAVVINGLDLTGTAADAMTAKFLTFETATGQDSSAVSAFHEILNAWNLDASSAAGIMDKLEASHQKYGSVVTENQSALLAIAPAMQAMNMTIDDGIGLLNLFDVAGINAAKVPMALQFAIKQLKPGQTINDLIAQISSIQDPTLRAQEAMKAFGTRGGVQLAQAFQPGIVSIDQFKTSVTENTDAVLKADNAIRSAFGNQAVLLLHQFQGGMADMATSLGTSSDAILMAAALLGPKLATGILAGFGGAAGLLIPKLAAMLTADVMPWMTTGTKIGTVMGTAIGPAMALAVPAAIILGLEAAKPPIQNWLDSMGLKVPNLFQGQGPLAPPGQIVPVGPQTTYAEGNAAAHEAALKATGAYATGIADGTPAVVRASKDLGHNVLSGFLGALQISGDKVVEIWRTGFFSGGVAGIVAAAKSTGAAGMEALAAAIVADRQKPLDAMDALTEMLKTSLTPSKEAARIAGQLTSKTLADGLNDGRADVRAQAIGTYQDLLSRLGALRDATGSIGKAAMDELRAGMKNKNPEIAKTAHDAMVVLMTGLADRASQATPAGKAAMDALNAGILSKIPEISAASLAAMKVATDALASGTGAAYAAGQGDGWAFIDGMTGVVSAQTGFVIGSVKLPTGTTYRPPLVQPPVTVHVTTAVTTAPASARQNQQAATVTSRWGGKQKT